MTSLDSEQSYLFHWNSLNSVYNSHVSQDVCVLDCSLKISVLQLSNPALKFWKYLLTFDFFFFFASATIMIWKSLMFKRQSFDWKLFSLNMSQGMQKHLLDLHMSQTVTVSQANYSNRHITVILHIDTPKQVSSEAKMQNWSVIPHIKSVFSNLALLLRIWQRNFFSKLEKRVKQRN